MNHDVRDCVFVLNGNMLKQRNYIQKSSYLFLHSEVNHLQCGLNCVSASLYAALVLFESRFRATVLHQPSAFYQFRTWITKKRLSGSEFQKSVSIML